MIIHGINYQVEDDEFVVVDHPEYTTLTLIPELALYDRIIGLVRELGEVFKESRLISIGTTHGGYIPIRSADRFKEVFCIRFSSKHLKNVAQNVDQKKINIWVNPVVDEKIDIVVADYFDGDLTEIINNRKYIILSRLSGDYNLRGTGWSLKVHPDLVGDFERGFQYCLSGNYLNFDNLINLCIMVKDAGEGFEEILKANLPFIDRYTILDTGSSDGTVDVLRRVLAGKRGEIYEESFINFRDSRNRCLELAGTECFFTVMLDDTYILTGQVREFLTVVRTDQFADSFNVKINSSGVIYGSNRILKAHKELKYIYKIHEIVQIDNNVIVDIPLDRILIEDIENDYMHIRTEKRKEHDLQLLFEEIAENPDDPRHYYYVAQTYKELKQYKEAYQYYTKRIEHKVEGFEEEVTDSYFERAYLADFHLGYDWAKCEELYLEAYRSDLKRSDAIFCIGYHYENVGLTTKAFHYYKKAFELGFPLESHISLRTNIYNEYVPQFLTGLCYQEGEYKLGKLAAEKYLRLNGNNETIESWWHIYDLLCQISDKEKKTSDGKIFCIVADGGFVPWNGSSIETEGVGGSETYVIKMSEQMVNLGYEVYVFCKCSAEEEKNGVKYRDISGYVDFLCENRVDTCLVSRFSQYVPVAMKCGVENVYLVVHDLTPAGNVIPVHDELKAIFCLTEWHRGYFTERFPALTDRVKVLGNGINLNRFEVRDKKKNSFIYSSYPNRGLIHLLRYWYKIREHFEGAILNVFCDLEGDYANSVAPDEMREIRELINQEGVTNHGWVSKDELDKYWMESEYWLYPCQFLETFCITALEAAANGVLAICNGLAGLSDTVGDRGIIVEGEINEEWFDRAIEKILRVNREELITRNRQWAEGCSWDKLARRMVGDRMYDKNVIEKYYGPIQHNINYLCNRFKNSEKVLEVGPGNIPFPLATHYIDHIERDNLQNLTVMDVNKDKIPYPDNYFDFVYCRHVMEDINNPEFLFKELTRVSRCGYIETPSPFAETTRHIDGSSPYYRGYIHHHSIIWEYDGILNILPKYPILEYTYIQNNVELLKDPYYWNTYYLWDNNCKVNCKKFNYDLDYNLHTEYGKMLKLSLTQSKESIEKYKIKTKNLEPIHILDKNIIQGKEIDMSKLQYHDMYNWTNDVPNGSKSIFHQILSKFEGKSCRILEIGTYTGTSVIGMLKYLPDSEATTIDMWEDYDEAEILQNMRKNKIEEIYYQNLNTADVQSRVRTLKGDSRRVLLNMVKEREKYDFIYVDGSHTCLDCYSDMMMSWELLDKGGIMGVDDYLWRNNVEWDRPYYAVKHFMERYKGEYEILSEDYRIFFRKLH